MIKKGSPGLAHYDEIKNHVFLDSKTGFLQDLERSIYLTLVSVLRPVKRR